MKRRQVPTLTFMIETHDGGAHWYVTTAPLMGNLMSVKMADNIGLAVFGFEESFTWPSEVYKLDLNANKSSRVFRGDQPGACSIAHVSAIARIWLPWNRPGS